MVRLKGLEVQEEGSFVLQVTPLEAEGGRVSVHVRKRPLVAECPA